VHPPRFLRTPLGTYKAAALVLLAWRGGMTALMALEGHGFESLVASLVLLTVALLALGPPALLLALRPRLGWTSGQVHLAGYALFVALHAPLWALGRAGIFGDPAFYDRAMGLLFLGTALVVAASHGHVLQREGKLALPERGIFAVGVVVVAAAMAAAFALPAASHAPAFSVGVGSMAQPVMVPGGEDLSWAVSQRIPAEGAAVFGRHLSPGTPLVAGLVLPASDRAEGFRPSLAIIGPGLPPPDASANATLPVAVPEGLGVRVAQEWSGRGWEGFTEIPILEGPDVRGVVVQGGLFRYVVWDPRGQGGEVWFAIGQEEAFGPFDLHRFAAAYLEMRLRFW
jgi:hypothetical protein